MGVLHGHARRIHGCSGGTAAGGGEQKTGEDGEERRPEDAVSVNRNKGLVWRSTSHVHIS